jgi:peptidoglycan hydrolase CwlO-like protein
LKKLQPSKNKIIHSQPLAGAGFILYKKYMKRIFIFLVLVSLIFPVVSLGEDLASQCAQVTQSTNGCPNLNEAGCKALLQKCADFYDQQSAALAEDITKTSQQKNTLQNAINGLKKKISSLESQINQSTVMVKDLNIQISDTEQSINKTTDKISDTQIQMTNILRSVNEEDKKPSFVILLEGNLSDFFSNLAYLDGLNSKMGTLLDSSRNLKTYLEDQQVKMNDNVDQLQKTIALQTVQKQVNESNKKEQDKYLKLTETQYQLQVAAKQTADAQSAKIKAMLFQVVGTTKAPTFGEALEIAKTVGQQVSIRPAFLLAIISQESAIGRNVGQCVLTDDLGNGKKISTGVAIAYPRAMHPTRDIPVFLQITKSLGKNPYDTPISCWIYDVRSGKPYGWGGAMGPAQFIPSTWNLFAARLQAILGRPGNPWAIQDSFTASGLYLADLGATAQTSAKESNAASRYYGGSSAYARSVMSRASCIQTFIDNGTMSTSCENLIF